MHKTLRAQFILSSLSWDCFSTVWFYRVPKSSCRGCRWDVAILGSSWCSCPCPGLGQMLLMGTGLGKARKNPWGSSGPIWHQNSIQQREVRLVLEGKQLHHCSWGQKESKWKFPGIMMWNADLFMFCYHLYFCFTALITSDICNRYPLVSDSFLGCR